MQGRAGMSMVAVGRGVSEGAVVGRRAGGARGASTCCFVAHVVPATFLFALLKRSTASSVFS